MKGIIRARVINVDGTEYELEPMENLIVASASLLAAASMKGDFPGVTYMAVGTGTATVPFELVGDTTLGTELTRVATTNTYDSTDATLSSTVSMVTYDNAITCTGTFGGGVIGSITELGLFGGPGASAANGGFMVNHKTFAPINKVSGSTIIWEWSLIF